MNSAASVTNDQFEGYENLSNEVIIGTCMEMCPESEIVERGKLFIVHRLECSNDINDPSIERQRSRK